MLHALSAQTQHQPCFYVWAARGISACFCHLSTTHPLCAAVPILSCIAPGSVVLNHFVHCADSSLIWAWIRRSTSSRQSPSLHHAVCASKSAVTSHTSSTLACRLYQQRHPDMARLPAPVQHALDDGMQRLMSRFTRSGWRTVAAGFFCPARRPAEKTFANSASGAAPGSWAYHLARRLIRAYYEISPFPKVLRYGRLAGTYATCDADQRSLRIQPVVAHRHLRLKRHVDDMGVFMHSLEQRGYSGYLILRRVDYQLSCTCSINGLLPAVKPTSIIASLMMSRLCPVSAC